MRPPAAPHFLAPRLPLPAGLLPVKSISLGRSPYPPPPGIFAWLFPAVSLVPRSVPSTQMALREHSRNELTGSLAQ